VPANAGLNRVSTQPQASILSEDESAIMEEITKLAKKEFSDHALTPYEYEELMILSSNFTTSFEGTWSKRHQSVALCEKSGDLI